LLLAVPPSPLGRWAAVLAMMMEVWFRRITTQAYCWLLRIASLILAAYGFVLLERARR
jgi:hypothetical protein